MNLLACGVAETVVAGSVGFILLVFGVMLIFWPDATKRE